MPASRVHNTTFSPNPVQRSFILSQAPADLFSSRVGEGKSTGLVWSCFYHTRNNPGADWVFIRDTYENLQKSTQRSFFEWFPPGVYGTWNATRKEFTWAEQIAKGTVSFVGMDDPQDASKLLSWVLAGIAIDEPAPSEGNAGVPEMVFDLGMMRLRQPGMNWYAMKLATNNPDEEHWTYRKFVKEAEHLGYKLHQPVNPENIQNLPAGYYERLRNQLGHRPDLVRRFIDGQFGFQQTGVQVTPQWNDRLHLTLGLAPIRGQEIQLLWDFGHNPTCIITQRTPLGYWNILDAYVGEGIGVEELIEGVVIPRLRERYKTNPIKHIGDPAGLAGEQTSIMRSPVKAIKKMIGGVFRKGPVNWEDRKVPLQAVLSRTISGTGLVQVDRENAKAVWHALRGGWHYHKSRLGTISAMPQKDIHSHPGDAMSYGAALLFPTGRVVNGVKLAAQEPTHYFGDNNEPFRIGPKVGRLPKDGEVLSDTNRPPNYFG